MKSGTYILLGLVCPQVLTREEKWTEFKEAIIYSDYYRIRPSRRTTMSANPKQ